MPRRRQQQIPPERLQKVLAQALGVSRRLADQWIEQGRVTLDGEVAVPGVRVAPPARISLDGKPVPLKMTKQIARSRASERPQSRALLYHKPVGEECTHRPGGGRKSIFDALPPCHGRWLAAGRLDVTTSGLLMLTTDGDLIHKLTHPSKGFDREYMVRVKGTLDGAAQRRLTRPVQLEDGPAQFADLVEWPHTGGLNRWYCVTLMQGRNRLIHRLCDSENCTVNRLHRVRIGPLWLPRRLKAGQWAEMTEAQVQELWQWPGDQVLPDEFVAKASISQAARAAGLSAQKSQRSRAISSRKS